MSHEKLIASYVWAVNLYKEKGTTIFEFLGVGERFRFPGTPSAVGFPFVKASNRAYYNIDDPKSKRIRYSPTGVVVRWAEGELCQMVQCKLCGHVVPEPTAHRHNGGWIGDDCCWDERLRATE